MVTIFSFFLFNLGSSGVDNILSYIKKAETYFFGYSGIRSVLGSVPFGFGYSDIEI